MSIDFRKSLVTVVLLGFVAVSSLAPAKCQKPPNPFDVEAREYLGTPASELAVNRALDYLATKQQPNGHWESGNYKDDVAITGFCVLAFLSAGHQPGRGKYGEILTRSVEYLTDSVRKDGLVSHSNQGGNGPAMYGHAFATLALAELYGMTKRPDLRERLESATQLILQTQNSFGGWRYQPNATDADISVTAGQVVALRAATNAGLKVPDETVKKALKYIKDCQNNPDGGFSYQTTQHGSGPARTGAAITCLMLSGERTAKETLSGIRYLEEHPYSGGSSWMYKQHEFYAYYYCTQAYYQIGGDRWKRWFVYLRDHLVQEQTKEGCWEERQGVGREYATAMSVLVLQVPAGLLPIYQK